MKEKQIRGLKRSKLLKDFYKVGVILGLSKGEGEWPCPLEMTPAERKDPRKICSFQLFLDDGLDNGYGSSMVKSITILYDGITPVPCPGGSDNPYGLRIEGEELVGRIRPILVFELSKKPDEEEFLRYVWGSSYELCSSSQEAPFYAEDWNGYSSVLDQERLDFWAKHLKKHKAYCGRVFSARVLSAGLPSTKMKLGEPRVVKKLIRTPSKDI